MFLAGKFPVDTLLQAEADYRQERKTGYQIRGAKFTLRPAAYRSMGLPGRRTISRALDSLFSGLREQRLEVRNAELVVAAHGGDRAIAAAMRALATSCPAVLISLVQLRTKR